jgi:hypothetical protein
MILPKLNKEAEQLKFGDNICSSAWPLYHPELKNIYLAAIN